MEEEKKIRIDFCYIDQNYQESRLQKSFDPCILELQPELEFLVEEFKKFMLSAGFSFNLVEKIQLIEDEE